MNVIAYALILFAGGVVGLSLAAVINALGVPVKMAYYGGCRGFIYWVPWICAVGAVLFAYAFMYENATCSLPVALAAFIILAMGVMFAMSAVSLAEMLDVFTGPFYFIRPSEFKWIAFFIAAGKAVFCLYEFLWSV